MGSLSFFTKSAATLEDIERLAQECGYPCWRDRDEHGGSALRIPCTGALYGSCWHVYPWEDRPPEHLTRFHLAILAAYQPSASFRISYPDASLPQLRALLRRLLARFGGWAGHEDDWVETCDADTVEHLHPVPGRTQDAASYLPTPSAWATP